GDPATCGVDVEALKTTGEVLSAINRGRIFASLDTASDNGLQWIDGRVRWTTGENVGQVCEVRSVDFDTGEISLWALPAFLPAIGDQFDLLPGCDLTKATCKDIYNAFLRFGGFPDVPGTDAIVASPNAKN